MRGGVMEIQKSIDRLDVEIEELKTKIDEEHMLCQDITDLEELIDKAIMFGDLCAKRDAKAQAVPEGFVLVEKSKISHFWQDDNEPENFCLTESDFECLGDCIDLGEIMEINKFTQIPLGKEKLYGTWVADSGNPLQRSRSKFFVGTESECKEIVLENERVFEEAQEQKVTELKIEWASDCFNCGHHEAIIYSTASEAASKGWFHDGDKAKCCKCGHEGEIDARGEDSDICWYENEAQEPANEL